jgi:NitT/TauT family transport system substrate-binding protein
MPSLSRRSVLTGLVAAPFVLRSARGRADVTNLKFALSATFDGSAAPFLLAEAQGWYKEAGLACQFDTSGGAAEVTARVGSGVYDAGVCDINVMSEFNAKNPAQAFRAVYMLYFRSPLCVCTLTKSGIAKPADLAGRKIGAAATDGAYRLFPAYVKATGLDTSAIKWDMVGLQLREAVLARGDVDAILGFDFTMEFGLQKTGLKAEDIRFLRYADAGMDLYSNSIVVSEKMRTSNPDAVKRFVAVTARGWKAAIADPKAALDALVKHSPLVNPTLELAKLNWLIQNEVITAESKANGLGAIKPERLTKAIDILINTYNLSTRLKPEDVFDASFLPSADLRKLPA